jgi:Immunity protein 74
MLEILTRGSVVFEFEGKTVTLQGEGYLRGHGSPDWVIYENSLVGWDPPPRERNPS